MIALIVSHVPFHTNTAKQVGICEGTDYANYHIEQTTLAQVAFVACKRSNHDKFGPKLIEKNKERFSKRIHKRSCLCCSGKSSDVVLSFQWELLITKWKKLQKKTDIEPSPCSTCISKNTQKAKGILWNPDYKIDFGVTMNQMLMLQLVLMLIWIMCRSCLCLSHVWPPAQYQMSCEHIRALSSEGVRWWWPKLS